MLSGATYLKRYREHPGTAQLSVLVAAELVGAGAGDKRRAMTNQNIDFGRAWQLLRTKCVVTLATLPDWNDIDKRLKKLADYRVRCRERPIGTFQAYKITVPFNSSKGVVKTKGLGPGHETRRITFPNMDAENDPYYRDLVGKKDDLIHSNTWDADQLGEDGEPIDPEEVKRHEQVQYAIRLYEPWDEDRTDRPTQKEVADVIDSKGKTWVGNRIREWRDGEHRELVPDPTR